MKLKMWVFIFLICTVCTIAGCGGSDNVISNQTNGTLSIESIVAPTSASGQGSVTVKLIAPTGGPGTGTITITASDTKLAAFSPATQAVNSNGVATFLYTATAVDKDTIVPFTVAIETLSLASKLTILGTTTNPAVINAQVKSIAFVSASPASISLKGTGGFGRTETSVVSFIVRDVTGQPLPGQIIDFTLDTSVGGITLGSISATSDSVGVVRAFVSAGVVSTPVRVTAKVSGKDISVKSDQLIISIGLPHQDGLSISATTLNPEAWNFDGVEVPVIAMLSDHFGNPVPDGTAVYFMAYGGSIEANATTKNGIATVKWRSQNPRPADGKAKILVYAIGEETFTDYDGSGYADKIPFLEFKDLPEAFLDIDGNGTFTCGTDQPINFGLSSGSTEPDCTVYNLGDGWFNGVLQGEESKIAKAPTSLHIFKNYQIIMSGSQPTISTVISTIGRDNSSTNIIFTIKDINGNSLPENTKIELNSSTAGCSNLVSGGSFVATPGSITIDATGSQTTLSTNLKNSCSVAGNGNLTVTVTTPKGIKTVKEFVFSY